MSPIKEFTTNNINLIQTLYSEGRINCIEIKSVLKDSPDVLNADEYCFVSSNFISQQSDIPSCILLLIY